MYPRSGSRNDEQIHLSIRTIAEDSPGGATSAAALAEGYRVDEVLRKQFDNFERELDALKEFCRRKVSPGGLDIDRLVEAQRYELVTRAQQGKVAEQRETVAAEIERRRQALVEADREVRVLEKLRERLAEQRRREGEVREARRLDEVATQQTYRKMAGSREQGAGSNAPYSLLPAPSSLPYEEAAT